MPVENASYGVKESTFELFPADVYDCKLTDINRKTLPVTDKETGQTIQADFLEFEFTIIGGEYDGKVFTDVGREYAELGPKAKLRTWMEGMTGQQFAGRTEPLNPNKLIGRMCRVNLSRGPNQKGKDCNKIIAILPAKKSGTAAAPKQAPQTPPSQPASQDEPLF